MSLLTRHGYIVSEDDLTEKHINELTVIANKGPYYDDAKPFSVFEDRHDGTVAIPRYWGEENFGNAEELFGHTESSSNLVFRGSLRSDLQREAVDKSIKQLKTQGGGVLSLFTGCGKTTISLYIACVLKLKTLVVVHKQFLLDQWEERIETFVPFARIGRLQQNIEDVADCDIVVGMLQSIAMREYDEDIFSDFGLIIFDEVHVVPAPVFSRALLRLCAPYMLGLSATPIRKDGLSKVIHWFIGPIFFEHFLTGQDNVTVEVMHFKLRRKLPMNMVVAITMLCNMTQRNTLLVEKAANLVSMGYKVMFLSDRRAHCETLRNDLLDIGIEGGLYLGSMKSFELERSKQKQVLLGTYHLAKEGLDIPTLDALILATPRSDVVQACGRILHGKTSLSPVIVDLVDDWIISKAQFNKRGSIYGLEVCEFLNMDVDFIARAFQIRNMITPDKTDNEVQLDRIKISRYNRGKAKLACESCGYSPRLPTDMPLDIHHMRHQSSADENDMIDGKYVHARSNLKTLCKKCHISQHRI